MTPAEKHRESQRRPCTCSHGSAYHRPLWGCRVQGCKCGLPVQVLPTKSKLLEQQRKEARRGSL
ncbi:MAG: hypothetical protein NTV51_00310 [Verrucomicrobia bacterium]|nr:hypothetical protein [Verrucomicrobiota bacterium]